MIILLLNEIQKPEDGPEHAYSIEQAKPEVCDSHHGEAYKGRPPRSASSGTWKSLATAWTHRRTRRGAGGGDAPKIRESGILGASRAGQPYQGSVRASSSSRSRSSDVIILTLGVIPPVELNQAEYDKGNRL